MRRLIIVSTTSLLLAAPAVAATPTNGTFTAPKGKVERGYDLQFKVSKRGKRISKLVAHVLESCTGESTSSTTTVGPGLTWKVKHGKFSGRKKETSGSLTLYTTLKGRFVSKRKAVGVIRQESIVAGATCDTYELDFTALRG